jgi:hypothetical protein
MGGTYGDPMTEAPAEAEPAPTDTVEVVSERGPPKPNNEVLAVPLDSFVRGWVSGIEVVCFTELSSRSRSTIRAEAGAGGEKLVGLLERRRRVLWLSNAILCLVYNPNPFQIV